MPTGSPGVFVELRRKLQSGLVIIRKEGSQGPAEVVLTGGESSLSIKTLADDGELILALPAGVAVHQDSCVPVPAGESRGEELNSRGEELHFRLRLRVSAEEEANANISVMEKLRPQETFSFLCQNCRTRLLEDRSFKRVLPLPTGDWNSIVDDWCCHPDPFAGRKLLPRAEDCLLGDTFLLLPSDPSCDHTLTQEVTQRGSEHAQNPKKACRRLVSLRCKSCSMELGEAVTPGVLKLYCTQVLVEAAEGAPPGGAEPPPHRCVFLEKSVSSRLMELSRYLNSFHFSVQTPDGANFLLIWLLNSDSIVASVPPRAEGSDPVRSTGAARAVKVVYIACSNPGPEEREVISSWEVSVRGHPVVLPPSVCEELLTLMNDSNASLPESMRRMRSYQVAYLRL